MSRNRLVNSQASNTTARSCTKEASSNSSSSPSPPSFNPSIITTTFDTAIVVMSRLLTGPRSSSLLIESETAVEFCRGIVTLERRHLQHPAWRSNASLVLDGGPSAAAAPPAPPAPPFSVFQTVIFGYILLEHDVRQQTLGTTKGLGESLVGGGLGLGRLSLAHAGVVHCVGLLDLTLDVGLDLALLLVQLGLGVLFLAVGLGVGLLGLAVEVGVGVLLGRFFGNLRAHEIFGSESLELRGGFLGLDFPLQLGVTRLGSSPCLDLRHLDPHVQLGLTAVSASILEISCFVWPFFDASPISPRIRASATSIRAWFDAPSWALRDRNAKSSSRIGQVLFGRFQSPENTRNYFLHGHARHNHSSLTLNDAFDDVLDMAPLRRRNGQAVPLRVRRRPVRVSAQQECVLLQRFRLIVRSDG
ncbi:hypothetical protein KCU88_g181, partial [Aureobasidium melanogenum]